MRLDLTGLNPEQREAVEHGKGPLLVLAGAGTGKTRVITYRIAHLMAQRGIAGDQILGITFTNKAAREMRERLEKMYPDLDPMPILSTFHGFGLRILREEYRASGLRSRFPIYDDSDVRSVLTDVIRQIVGLSTAEARIDDVRQAISRWKSEFVAPERAIDHAEDDLGELCARVYLRYRDRMAGLSAVDFDDLIYLPVKVLESDQEVSDRWKGRFEHLLIDEYQDTNAGQYRFASALVGVCERIRGILRDNAWMVVARGSIVVRVQ